MLVLVVVAVILMILAGIALIVKMHKNAMEDNLKYEMFYFPNFPMTFKEITIFFISDIHRREVSPAIVEEAKGIAELVIIGGDLLEKGVQFDTVRSNLRKLKEIGPVFFVWGNNDYEADIEKLKELFSEENVTVLDNRSVSFTSPKKQKWHLAGIEDRSLEHDDLEMALQGIKKSDFKILVSHNPKVMEDLTDDDGVTLVLSGHTHGGQIRILGFGPYEKGTTKVIGKTTILVSNGYGTTSIPLRLGAKPETHIIKIQHTKDKRI
ncbi:metallophosphoesterase family protein [Niallia taxi]|uniref:metallophosphoesterase n=1 Tax=Niallia taxi TaxID=2499688 RepID=UPI0039820D19